MPIRKKIRDVSCFLLCALVLQVGAVLFCTAEGVSLLYPLCEATVAEKVVPEDQSYTEYFSLRESCSDADIIVLGIDFLYDISYTLVLDLLRSIRHDCDIGTVFVVPDPASLSLAAAAISSGSRQGLDNSLAVLQKQERFTDGYLAFLRSLWEMKEEYPPQKRYTGGTLDVAGEITPELLVQAVHDACQSSGRAALLITDAEAVHPEAPFYSLIQELPLTVFGMQCLTEETNRSDREVRITLVDSAQLLPFDELYAAVSKRIGGTYPPGRYTDSHSTRFHFLIRNCIPGQITPYTENSEGANP